MTDREKLLVFMLSECDDADVSGTGVTLLEVVAMLHELGADQRRMWRDIDLAVGV